MPDDPTPRRLDRVALDRVLARAAELQSSFSEGADANGMLTESQIVELGKEAGLSPEHLRQAMAEERTRGAAPEESGLASMILGPARIQASRVVSGNPAEILDAVDAWMLREEGLLVKRKVGDRIVWEPRRDFFGNLSRALNFGGRGYALTRAGEVAATATAVDQLRSLIVLDAGLAQHRTGLAGGVGAASAVSATATGIAVVVGVMLPVALLPIIIVPGLTLALSRQRQAQAVSRGQLALEQLLDHLERGDHRRPGGLLGAISATAAALQGRR